ncbi:uncharacterized protein LOC129291846 [Prosopis cineraria]|uniref:uncharacterized protein LOC129291846 n=1 Tax=Prosopis cineraria TaxID=364024 RepID=UPI00240F34C6|nr:uncharacterized protein LOC129291846 [Prosopis cineraria]XP_054785373.1 uncharacterized protein LOC129291846 [Prosopis cineraria]
MAAEVKKNSDHDSQFKTAPLRATKTKNQRNQGGDELLKAVLTKRTKKASMMESTTSSTTIESNKKTCVSTQNLQTPKRGKLFKAPTKKMIDEKANINESESKNKSREESKKMCTCSPTTHEGSFRCHLHRNIGADHNNSITEKKSTLSCHSIRTHHIAEFKPQLSRFGRAASAELVITTQDSLSQPSVVSSS